MVTKLHKPCGRCSYSMELSQNATYVAQQSLTESVGFFNHWRRDNDLIYDSIRPHYSYHDVSILVEELQELLQAPEAALKTPEKIE